VFVHPQYRRTGHAAALHAWMKQQVQSTGIPMLTGILAPDRLEAKCRLYRRRFSKTGEFFIHLPPYFQCAANLGAPPPGSTAVVVSSSESAVG
jgi:hypothetical protein